MIENEQLRAYIDRYLMERFKYCKSLSWLSLILSEAKFSSISNMVNEQHLKFKRKREEASFSIRFYTGDI